MSKKNIYKSQPDYKTPPGVILEEILETRGISKSDFAVRCDLSTKHISQIIHAGARILPETAIAFERVLGISAIVWINLESNYRLYMERLGELEKNRQLVDWANKFPVKKLIERKMMDTPANHADTVTKLFDFFSVTNHTAWKSRYEDMVVLYRNHERFVTSVESITAWLRVSEILASDIHCESYERHKFKNCLDRIREMTRRKPDYYIPKMQEECSISGVALVFVPCLPNTNISGATYWIKETSKPVLVLSARYKRNDNFWFTFFHEAFHILNHRKKERFIHEFDQIKHPSENDEEIEANNWAGNFLIPENDYANFQKLLNFRDRNSILRFSEEIGIAPGIVVGRLQNDGKIPFNRFRDLIEPIDLNITA